MEHHRDRPVTAQRGGAVYQLQQEAAQVGPRSVGVRSVGVRKVYHIQEEALVDVKVLKDKSPSIRWETNRKSDEKALKRT